MEIPPMVVMAHLCLHPAVVTTTLDLPREMDSVSPHPAEVGGELSHPVDPHRPVSCMHASSLSLEMLHQWKEGSHLCTQNM